MMMNQQQQQPLINTNQSLMSMNQIQQMTPFSRGHRMWAPPPLFSNHIPDPASTEPPQYAGFGKLAGPRTNWRVNGPYHKRRKDQRGFRMAVSTSDGMNVTDLDSGNPNISSYQLPASNELQHKNRLETRIYLPKNKFNKKNGPKMIKNRRGSFNKKNSRSAPYAPRNTTSFLIRAKKSGGIASLVSPCPATPAVLPTPSFSPSRQVLVDMAKEEWGVDGYGSMKGLIRLRSPGHETEAHVEDEEVGEGSSESDVEAHVQVERRLDHDLSRFEMICNPSSVGIGGMDSHNVLETRVEDQDNHIAQLEEENLILKERLFSIESELDDLRRMMQCLERRGNRGEEAVENESEDDSEGRAEETHSMEDNNEDCGDDNVQGDECFKGKGDDGDNAEVFAKEEKVLWDVEEIV